MMFGLMLFGKLSDKLLSQKAGQQPTTGKSEDRLILMNWIGPVTLLRLFVYGWRAQYQTLWLAPILGTVIVGLESLFVCIPGQIYLVDVYGSEGARRC
ncbi:hypothetical protein BDW02DRAFT_565448 [Decorospora gaudefroyi]|uniref:Uncharacterized protein n=1 Tax=Decorospora gaudefroyi TaxID=184978 RepID=A0A6A5KHZ0_9PLEO|nr:hypothetical protein BDW02DRAFT_565448 [Decorospora gaudefroyi]